MEKEKQMTCEKRIDEQLKDRITEIEKALELASNSNEGKFEIGGDEYSDITEWINCYSLAYSDDPYYRAKRLELSCGGPQDYFLFFGDGSIEYHFLDWFDGAKRELEGKEEEIMQNLFDQALNF